MSWQIIIYPEGFFNFNYYDLLEIMKQFFLDFVHVSSLYS